MDISSRWFKAVGFSLVAGAVTARYVSKWKRSRLLHRHFAPSEREAVGGRHFVGLDLTDPTAAKPRSCDVAVLDPELRCEFSVWDYEEHGAGIVPESVLGRSFILAVDGPQGLAGKKEATVRESERITKTPGRTPYTWPENGKPYAGFITGSVKLFYQLVTSGSRFRLLGFNDIPLREVNLLEVFPGAAWRALAGQRLPRKNLKVGRQARLTLLRTVGVQFPDQFSDSKPPTADQLDAAMAAWTAYCFDHGDQGGYIQHGFPPKMDGDNGVLREGFIVQPVLGKQEE